MLQIRKQNCADRNQRIEHTVVLLFLLVVFIAEIYRLVRWNFTWDESLTYIHFIKPVFFDQKSSIAEIIAFYQERTGYWCAMNNHLLNTLSMAAAGKLFFRFFGYANEIVLRLPVFGCFCLYIGAVIHLYRKKRITWTGVLLLCGSRYMMDFFALSRGYAIAAAFVLLACVCIDEWERTPEKEWLVVLGIFWVTVGIIAQTVTFIIAAPIYLWLLLRILQRKSLTHFFKPLRLIVLLPLAALNAGMLAFHFVVSNADHCLSPSGEIAFRSVMKNIFIGGHNSVLYYAFAVLFWLFLIAGWMLFFRKKKPWKRMGFTFIFTVYLLPMSLIVNTVRQGLPISRMLLPAFPVMALAIHDCICELAESLPTGIRKVPAMLCVLAILSIWGMQHDLSISQEWPCCQGIKAQCYEALADGTKVVPPVADSERSESWTFYRDQISNLTGYDIIDSGIK